LFELIVAEPALELAFEDAAGIIGADFREGADLYDEMHTGTKAGFHLRQFTAFQEVAKGALAAST